MRTTVSDVLLFNKCPYAWWAKHVIGREPIGGSSPALEYGTKIHKIVAGALASKNTAEAALYLEPKSSAALSNFVITTEVMEIETAHSVEIGGHEFLYRPDAVVKKLGSISTFQLKTASASKAHLFDIVRYSPHECLYAWGLKNEGKYEGFNTKRTITMLWVKSKKPQNDKIKVQSVFRTGEEINDGVIFCVKTADRMEEMLREAGEDQAKAREWHNPSSCIDWITGTRCGYQIHCAGKFRLQAEHVFKNTEDRYADLQGTPPPEPPTA